MNFGVAENAEDKENIADPASRYKLQANIKIVYLSALIVTRRLIC